MSASASLKKLLLELVFQNTGEYRKRIIKEYIELVNNPALIQSETHVYKIWEDGEITLEKAQHLYGMRTMHTIEAGFNYIDFSMPLEGKIPHSFAIVTEEDAKIIRELLLMVFTNENEK
jgi:hypothetical protein